MNTPLTVNKKPINCIQQIFEQDSIYGHIRNHASEKIPLSEVINNYTKDIKSLDFTQCPPQFKSAFDQHIDAWLDFKNVSDQYPSLRGELHDIFDMIGKTKDSTAYKAGLNQIMETWKVVKENAK